MAPGASQEESVPQLPSDLRASGSLPPFWYQAQNAYKVFRKIRCGRQRWTAHAVRAPQLNEAVQECALQRTRRSKTQAARTAHLLHGHAIDENAGPIAPLARVLMLVAGRQEPAVRVLCDHADIPLHQCRKCIELRYLLRVALVAVYGLHIEMERRRMPSVGCCTSDA